MGITQLGDPVLLKMAKPVKEIDKNIRQLVSQMSRIMTREKALGIAAPQVGKSIRLFILKSEDKPLVAINPEIINHGEIMETDWEGCLSIPGLRGKVRRFANVFVRYTDVEGNLVELSLMGMKARVFQHELDHLDGTLFIERVDIPDGLIMESEYIKLMKG